MTDEDPRPLKSAGETPAGLVRALRALGQPDRDSARLARVAQRLGARVAASGTTSGSGIAPALRGGASLSLLGKLATTKTGLTGLVLGFGVLGVLGYALMADRHAPRPAAEIPPAPTPVAGPAMESAAPAPAPAPALPSEPAQPLTPPAPVLGGHRPRVARSKEGSRSAAPKPATPTAAPTAQPSAAEAPAEPVPAKPSATEVQPRAQPAPNDKAPIAQPSEVALLHRARKLATTQPAAALAVLHEHSERFPNGMLTPEREMLTIEALRRLGRSAEASERLRQFELRYPQSLYLRRLQH